MYFFSSLLIVFPLLCKGAAVYPFIFAGLLLGRREVPSDKQVLNKSLINEKVKVVSSYKLQSFHPTTVGTL